MRLYIGHSIDILYSTTYIRREAQVVQSFDNIFHTKRGRIGASLLCITVSESAEEKIEETKFGSASFREYKDTHSNAGLDLETRALANGIMRSNFVLVCCVSGSAVM
jgi:hypothetical protein